MIDSKNRDKSSYQQPTNLTLRPPRVYKNIISIQLLELKFAFSLNFVKKDIRDELL